VKHCQLIDHFHGPPRLSITCNNIAPDESLLSLRGRTNKVDNKILDLDKVRCRVFDVGGSKFECGKWADCIKDVDSVVFVVFLTGYCRFLPEDPDVVSHVPAVVSVDS